MIQIIKCNPSHDSAWNDYVARCPRASFYHRVEWRNINEQCFGHQTAYLGAFDGTTLVGVLPMVRLQGMLFGNIACSMPFVNHGGPCGDTPAIEQALLDAASKVADEWQVDYFEIRSQRDLGVQYPCAMHKVSMTIGLDPDPEVLLTRFEREQRKEIRRAAKNGFVVRFGAELIDDFYKVLCDGWRDLGTPIFRASYLKAILRAFPHDVRVCVVYDPQGRPAAAAFEGVHNGTVEGMWLGIRPEYRKQLVGYVLYWALIQDACRIGATTFHLGRSTKDSGGEQFKKKWNAEMVQLYWQYVLRTTTEIPFLSPANTKYRFAVKAWQKLPVGMTRVIGPFIAKSIP
jgi:FemAB-related protein (PEP-CTERM system-associated)